MKTKPMSMFPGVKDGPSDESFVEDPEIPEIPLSWVNHLSVSVEDFQKRFPYGKKVMLYKHAKIEHYAPFMLKDGLVRRLSVYSDLKYTQLAEVREYFMNRLDHICLRITNILTENVIERFNSGRTDSLAEHKYKAYDHGPHSERLIIFYSHSRPDGLKWRKSGQTLLEEAFDKREDFLEHRTTKFGAKEKKFGPVEDCCRTIEVIAFLNNRTWEEAHSELYASVYNILKNEKALKKRQYLQKQKEAARCQSQEVVVDLLGPYLAQKGITGRMTKQEAQEIKQKCLQDFRQRLVNTANGIQSLFDQKMGELEKERNWFQEHQMSLTKEEEEKHRTFINETMFQLHVLDLHLNRHKEMAPLRYQAVEKKLDSDSRLGIS